MLQLKEGMSVVTPSGEDVGKISRFVLDPATNEVTHIVVEKGWLLPEDKLIPFDMVSSAADKNETLVLHDEIDDFESLPSFEETHFVRALDDEPGDPIPAGDPAYQYTPAYYWYPSQSNIGFPGIGLGHYTWPTGETKRNIPEGTTPLKEGTDVVSADGQKVGQVERLFVEPETNKVTHFLVSQGMLFKDRKLVPAHWVKSVNEDSVYLVVNSRLLERLPSYEE